MTKPAQPAQVCNVTEYVMIQNYPVLWVKKCWCLEACKYVGDSMLGMWANAKKKVV